MEPIEPARYVETCRQRKPRWCAVYTRSRAEKRVHEALCAKGCEAYLPLRAVTRQWSDRKKVVHVPLFSSYLFARSTPRTYGRILETPGVAGLVSFAGQVATIPDEQIEAVRRVLATAPAAEAHPLPEKGQRVRVTGGPLEGLEGQVVQVRGADRLLIRLDSVGQAISVLVPAPYLAEVETPAAHST